MSGRKTGCRLGGIYALEGVRNTSEQYHQPVLTLCAFVHDGTRSGAQPLPARRLREPEAGSEALDTMIVSTRGVMDTIDDAGGYGGERL
jgi:hypothetical protein